MIETLRYALAAVLLCAGTAVLLTGILGIYRFRFVLNRIHCAAAGDTLGFFLIVAGLAVAGSAADVPKLLLLLGLFWLGNPVASRLLARLELSTDEDARNHMDREDRT